MSRRQPIELAEALIFFFTTFLPELGYVSIDELSAVRGKLGLPVERDLHFEADKPLSAYADEARELQRIVA